MSFCLLVLFSKSFLSACLRCVGLRHKGAAEIMTFFPLDNTVCPMVLQNSSVEAAAFGGWLLVGLEASQGRQVVVRVSTAPVPARD